jgi:hypothetical protein
MCCMHNDSYISPCAACIMTIIDIYRSGAHPASYPKGTGGSFPGVKRPGREADH